MHSKLHINANQRTLGLSLGGEMANWIMCTGGIQANQLRQKLKANENWDKHQTLKDIKGHTLVRPPPFSTPSKLFMVK